MRPKADILAEVREAAAAGRREIQLLGQIVNHYSAPDDPGCDFTALVEAIHDSRGLTASGSLVRIRGIFRRAFSRRCATAEDLPSPASAGAIRINAHAAGDAAPLHPRELPRARRARFANVLPDVALSTDMIVGFPGETDADFEETLSLTRAVALSQHVLVQIFAAAEHARATSGWPTMCRTKRRRAGSWHSRRCSGRSRRTARGDGRPARGRPVDSASRRRDASCPAARLRTSWSTCRDRRHWIGRTMPVAMSGLDPTASGGR